MVRAAMKLVLLKVLAPKRVAGLGVLMGWWNARVAEP
jgi:hypothetical protein